jgi:hypothetical protein
MRHDDGIFTAMLRGRHTVGLAVGMLAVCVALLGGSAAVAQAVPEAQDRRDDGSRANELREFIGQQVGGLTNLKVPARNEELPLPRAADGTVPYRYELTEAKRYLGKLLFHDPVRTERIDINTGQPKDLPTGTAFGGTFNAVDPLIRQILPETSNTTSADALNIVAATKQTGSCGACHIGEAAGKAGQQLNFNVGGEGRG